MRDPATLRAARAASATIVIPTATTVVPGGFARERACICMCHWPGIRGATMNAGAPAVGHRHRRGEPRGRERVEGSDDRVDRMVCGDVRLTGHDIREGRQMECATCAPRVDACDDVMAPIGGPCG